MKLKLRNLERMNKERAIFLDERIKHILKESPHGEALKDLLKRLLAVGGTHAVLPVIEEDINPLSNLHRIKVWVRPKFKMMKGRPCGCHSNSASLWEHNQDKLRLCTGYYLGEDGCWRQHSWCWWPEVEKIVETTVKGAAYYGFRMTDHEAQLFLLNNC